MVNIFARDGRSTQLLLHHRACLIALAATLDDFRFTIVLLFRFVVSWVPWNRTNSGA